MTKSSVGYCVGPSWYHEPRTILTNGLDLRASIVVGRAASATFLHLHDCPKRVEVPRP